MLRGKGCLQWNLIGSFVKFASGESMKNIDEMREELPDKADQYGYFGVTDPAQLHSMALAKIVGGAFGDTGVAEALKDLKELMTSEGLEHQEELLMLQAELLNLVFVDNVMRMKAADMIPPARLFGDIALKAQNQCRRTVMALADLRNPKRTTFIRQQNNAVNQQVNNETGPVNPGQEDLPDQLAETKNLEKIASNELLEELGNVQRMDARKAPEAV